MRQFCGIDCPFWVDLIASFHRTKPEPHLLNSKALESVDYNLQDKREKV